MFPWRRDPLKKWIWASSELSSFEILTYDNFFQNFRMYFGAMLAPNIWKNQFICPSKTHRFWPPFWHWILCDLGSILGPKLRPCWPLVAHKTHPRPTKKAKQTVLGLMTLPRSIFHGCPMDCWLICDRFWIDFWLIFLQENGVARWGVHFVNKLSSQHRLIQGKPIHKHSSNLAPCGKALAYQIKRHNTISPAIADKSSGGFPNMFKISVCSRFSVFFESGRRRGKSLHAWGTFLNPG